LRALVTGVTGFVGGAIARRLARDGVEVRGFVRDPGVWSTRPDRAETAVGDVTDADSLRRAAEGCEVVVHAAALVKAWARDRRMFDRVNVQGLGHAVDAARAAGARLIYISSFIALGPTDGETFDEETRRDQSVFHNDYQRTKWVADQMARALSGDVRPVRIYPGVVFGPGALTAGNHVVALLLQHARGRLPGMLGAGTLRQCFAYVDDVADGVARALARATDGEGYILGGENRTAVELFGAFQAASGIAPPRRRIPFGVASAIGRLQSWRAALFGIEPELTPGVVRIYRHEWAYSSKKAERELGYRITPFDEAIGATVEWMRERGEL
jgi:farnesol dehydrogenase